MLTTIKGLPPNVLAIEAVDRVRAEDYTSVLVPALENILAKHSKARLLYVLGDSFDEFSIGAGWEDAKLGARHFTDFERVAVVTENEAIRAMVKAFGFAMPGEVRVYESDEFEDAKRWIAEGRSQGGLDFDFDEETGILKLVFHDELDVADFEKIAAVLDPYLEKNAQLNGLVLEVNEFPGWDSVSALGSHFRFVRDHQVKIRRIALVTDDRFLSIAPRIAKYFLRGEVRRFEPDHLEQAHKWVSSA